MACGHPARTAQRKRYLGIHDSGDADGILYYVLPHLEGESVRGRLFRCVPFEMLARQPPFTGPTVESMIRQYHAADDAHGPPPSAHSFRPTSSSSA